MLSGFGIALVSWSTPSSVINRISGCIDDFSSCNIIYIMIFCSVCERRRWGNVFPRVPTRVRAANYTKLCTALTPCIICRATSLVATFVKGSSRLGAIFLRHWRNPARWDGEVCFCALVLQIIYIYIYICVYLHTHIYIYIYIQMVILAHQRSVFTDMTLRRSSKQKDTT